MPAMGIINWQRYSESRCDKECHFWQAGESRPRWPGDNEHICKGETWTKNICCHIGPISAQSVENYIVSSVADGSERCHRLSRRSHGMCAGDGNPSGSGSRLFLDSLVYFISPINSQETWKDSYFPPTPILHLSHELMVPTQHFCRCWKGETTKYHPVISPHLIQHQTPINTVCSQTLILWTHQKELSHEIQSLLGSPALVSWSVYFGQNMQHWDGRQNTCESC